MHTYWAMGEARKIFGDTAIVRETLIVASDDSRRLKFIYEVGRIKNGEIQTWGGDNYEQAFDVARANNYGEVGDANKA